MSSASMPVTSSNQITTSKIWSVILASSVGTMIEWYDFYIFGTLAPYLAPKFYPPGNELFAYLAYLATFFVGFAVRPFGALFFGRIGDITGRNSSGRSAPQLRNSRLVLSRHFDRATCAARPGAGW